MSKPLLATLMWVCAGLNATAADITVIKEATPAVPIPPPVTTTQVEKILPTCTVDDQVRSNCKMSLILEEFSDLKNLTVNITTQALVPTKTAAKPVAAAPIIPVEEADAYIVPRLAAISVTEEPMTVGNIMLHCGFNEVLATKMVKYGNIVYSSTRLSYTSNVWGFGWYSWACSSLMTGIPKLDKLAL